MQVKIDLKSIVIGVILGAVLVVALGAAGASRADFGIAVEQGGYALVRAHDGTMYVIDVRSADAELIEHKTGPYKSQLLNLSRALPPDHTRP